jgi:hypothetical protein
MAYRFRESPQTINDALMLLKGMGRAQRVHRHGYWKLKLAGGHKDKWECRLT